MLFGLLFFVFAINLVHGQPFNIIQGKRPPIVGGYKINIDEAPYQVSLRRYGDHICGGSIFSDHVVITASHCVEGLGDSRRLSIVAGATFLNSADDGQELKVARFIMHPKYRSFNKDYDISVLILSGQLMFNQFVKPIPLAKMMATEGSKAFISGWGYIDQNIPITSNQLMAAEVEVFPDSSCKAAYWHMTTSRMICAGVIGGGIDACAGDSGGPMVYKGELIGVVSAGSGCGDPEYFGLYSKIPTLYEWIEDTVKNNSIHLI